MGEFPSGQRGQTVNLLAMPSMVRIHLPPPKIPITLLGDWYFSLRGGWRRGWSSEGGNPSSPTTSHQKDRLSFWTVGIFYTFSLREWLDRAPPSPQGEGAEHREADEVERPRFLPALPVVQCISNVHLIRRGAPPRHLPLKGKALTAPSGSPAALSLGEKVLSAARRMGWKGRGFCQRCRWYSAYPTSTSSVAAYRRATFPSRGRLSNPQSPAPPIRPSHPRCTQARGQLPPRQAAHERVKAVGAHRQPAARARPQIRLSPRRQRRKTHLASPHPRPPLSFVKLLCV